MPSVGTAWLNIAPNFKPVYAGLAAQQSPLSRRAGSIGRTVGLALGGGIAAAGGSVKLAVDFEKSMRNVNSIAQLNEKQFRKLNKQVLAMAGPTAQAPKTLADGLYDLVSSGFDAHQSIEILNKSARAATAGLTDTATSTKAVAAVLNAYHLPARKAGQVSDQLFQTVNRGVITFEELAQTIGDVLPFAASLGVGLDQVGASISTMTKAGISAPETMTRIKSIMQAFLKPSKEMAAALQQTGYQSGEALIKAKGFQGALEVLAKTTGGSKQKMAALFPNVRALGGALALTGKNTKSAEQDIKGFQNTTGATSKVLAEQSKSVAFQWNRLKARAEVLGISVGSKLLPQLSKVVGMLSDPHLSASEKFDRLVQTISRAISAAIPKMADAAAKAAPHVASAFVKGFMNASPWGRLAIAGFLIQKMGGLSAFSSIGGSAGGEAAKGFKGKFVAGLKGVGLSLALGAAISFGPDLVRKLQASIDKTTPTFHLPKTSKILGLNLGAHMQLFGKAKIDDEPLKKFGDTAEQTFKKLQKAGDSRGLTDLASQARAMAKTYPKASSALEFFANSADTAAKEAAGSFRNVSKVHTRSFSKIIQMTRDTEFAINQKLGYGTRVGTEALLTNFQNAKKKLQGLVGPDGKMPKSVRQGINQINTEMAQALQRLGLSKGQARSYLGLRNKHGAIGFTDKVERGGIVQFGQPGARGRDSIPVDFGGRKVLVAPGEVGVVFNRHQIPEVQERFADQGGLSGFFRRNNRPHHLAKGGVAAGNIWGGHPALSGGIANAVAAVLKRFPGLSVTSTTDHSTNTTNGGVSWHVKGKAADVAGAPDVMHRAADWVKRAFGPALEEGIHNPNLSYKHGKPVPSSFWGAATWGQHIHHIHMAILGALGKLAGGAARIRAPQIVGSGAVAALAQRALDVTTKGANRRLDQISAKLGGGDISMEGVGSGSGKALMQSISKQRGWNFADWWALDASETSHGRNLANPTSTARLRGQFLSSNWGKYGPGSDPRKNPSMDEQIRAMAAYIAERYGNPTKAWAFHRAHNWYARGGIVGAAKGLVTAAAKRTPGAGLANHFNPFTGHTTLMSTQQYDALKLRWRREHPGTAMPTSAPHHQHKPKKRKPHKYRPHISRLAQHLAHLGRNVRDKSGDANPWLKLWNHDEAKLADLSAESHADRVWQAISGSAQYLVDDDNNPDTPDILNQAGITLDGKFIPGIQQAADALRPVIANRVQQLNMLLGEKKWTDFALGIGDKGGGGSGMFRAGPYSPFKKLIDQLARTYKRIADRVKRNARRIRQTKLQLRTLTKKKHPTKQDRKREIKLRRNLANLQKEQRTLTGEDDPDTTTSSLHGFSEDTPIGKAWTSLSNMRADRQTLADNVHDLPARISEIQDELDLAPDGLRVQLADILGTTVPKTEQATAPAQDSESADLLRQLLDQSHLRERVLETQYDVLKNFPPFAGSFKDGGRIQGPIGAPRTAIVHGGERVLSVDEQGQDARPIYVVVQDGAVDPNKIRVIARDEVKVVTRRVARRGAAPLPGVGGG